MLPTQDTKLILEYLLVSIHPTFTQCPTLMELKTIFENKEKSMNALHNTCQAKLAVFQRITELHAQDKELQKAKEIALQTLNQVYNTQVSL